MAQLCTGYNRFGYNKLYHFPVTAIVKSDIFDGFDSVQENIADSSNMQTELVIEELKNRINEDVKARMEKEFKFRLRRNVK